MRFKTKKAAERFLAETALQAARGDYVAPANVPTFSEIAEDWYKSKKALRPSHVFDLRTRLDKHILPVFGNFKLDRITVTSVEKFRDDLRDREYARRTINPILRIMSAVFRLAIKRGQCSRNPLDSVERAPLVALELKAGETTTNSGADAVDLDEVLKSARDTDPSGCGRTGLPTYIV